MLSFMSIQTYKKIVFLSRYVKKKNKQWLVITFLLLFAEHSQVISESRTNSIRNVACEFTCPKSVL